MPIHPRDSWKFKSKNDQLQYLLEEISKQQGIQALTSLLFHCIQQDLGEICHGLCEHRHNSHSGIPWYSLCNVCFVSKKAKVMGSWGFQSMGHKKVWDDSKKCTVMFVSLCRAHDWTMPSTAVGMEQQRRHQRGRERWICSICQEKHRWCANHPKRAVSILTTILNQQLVWDQQSHKECSPKQAICLNTLPKIWALYMQVLVFVLLCLDIALS